jgi:hypothetical protein
MKQLLNYIISGLFLTIISVMLAPEVHAKTTAEKRRQCHRQLKKWHNGECVSCSGGKVYYKGNCLSKSHAENKWRENNPNYVQKCRKGQILYKKNCYSKRKAEREWSKDFPKKHCEEVRNKKYYKGKCLSSKAAEKEWQKNNPKKQCEIDLGFWAGNECMTGKKAKCKADGKVMYKGECYTKVNAEKEWLTTPKSGCLFKLKGNKGVKINTRLWHNKKCWEEVKQVKKAKKSKAKKSKIRKKRPIKRKSKR